MFTGIVEERGTVLDVERTADGHRFVIGADSVLADAGVGDSIAVNGVCLTAVEVQGDRFIVDVIPETTARSSLQALARGTVVNLERPMRADGRFDGHIVQGHVDGTGTIRAIDRSADGAIRIRIEADPDVMRYVVEKGSITVDGVSLTVAAEDEHGFEVALIPHTLEITNLGECTDGDIVNLEVDVLAKYVERLLNRGTT